MPLLNISNTTPIYERGALTTSTGYYEIFDTINRILKVDYGYQGGASHVIIAGETIKAEHWSGLTDDIDVIWRHQLNQNFEVETPPIPGGVVEEFFVNQVINAVNNADVRKYLRPPAEQRGSIPTSSSVGTGTTVVTWPASLKHTVELTWNAGNNPSAARDLLQFFNLGGRLSFNLACDSTTTGTSNLFWKDFITSSQSGISSFVFDRALLEDLPKQVNATTSTTFTNGNDSIKVSVKSLKRNGSANTDPDLTKHNRLVTSVELSNDKVGVNLTTTSTLTTEYSKNAIVAVTPDFNVTENFGDDPNQVFEPRESVRVTGNTNFEWRAGSTSTEEIITITNSGNTTTTITSYGVVSTLDSPNISTFINHNWDIGQPKPISPGASVSFRLYYYSDTVTYGTGQITINFVKTSSSPEPYTIRTTQNVKPKLFSFTLSPAFISYSTSSSSTLEQKFSIVPSNGTYSAQPAVSITPSAAYKITKQEIDGPTIQFNTSTNGTYNTVLSVIVTGTNSVNEITTTTVTSPISITRNAPTTQNLGTWKSALQPSNGIIGASYDLIDGKRYVTIGFGMGADGSYSLSNDPTGASAFVEFLGTNSNTVIVDSKYALSNPPLYAGTNDSAYTSFLQSTTNVGGYGTWIRPSAYLDIEGGKIGPVGYYVERTYKFTTPRSGLHTWTMASDNESYFTIDGGLVGDLRNVGYQQSYRTTHSGSVNLDAGEHTLTFYVINTGYAAAIALKIVDPASQEVWSTRFPIRIGFPYQNWQEVYRIPLTGIARIYQCNDEYCIKNSNAAAGQRWGYYFGTVGATANSMFTVTDDGSGNITIDMNAVDVNSADMTNLNGSDSNAYNTIANAPHLFYYFSNIRASIGYTQLSPSPDPDGTTRYFIGFSNNGVVRISSVIPPTDPTNTVSPQTGGGGGCPDPDTLILISEDGDTCPAGKLAVGDTVWTRHETSGRYTNYPVTAVEIDQQPRVRIEFDDTTNIIVSDTHKFLMNDLSWKQVFQLAPGDTIKGIGINKTVSGMESLGIGPVVKITVDQAHTYVAGGLISHNVKDLNQYTNLLQ